MVIFLAYRNIIRNIKESAIIFFFIAVITFLFWIGNSIIERADNNIRRSFIESLTGDVVIQKAGNMAKNTGQRHGLRFFMEGAGRRVL